MTTPTGMEWIIDDHYQFYLLSVHIDVYVRELGCRIVMELNDESYSKFPTVCIDYRVSYDCTGVPAMVLENFAAPLY